MWSNVTKSTINTPHSYHCKIVKIDVFCMIIVKFLIMLENNLYKNKQQRCKE